MIAPADKVTQPIKLYVTGSVDHAIGKFNKQRPQGVALTTLAATPPAALDGEEPPTALDGDDSAANTGHA